MPERLFVSSVVLDHQMATRHLQECARLGSVAVGWVMARPARPVPIVSACDAGQLAPSLAALNFPMGPGLYAAIAALYPAPPPATDRTEETS